MCLTGGSAAHLSLSADIKKGAFRPPVGEMVSGSAFGLALFCMYKLHKHVAYGIDVVLVLIQCSISYSKAQGVNQLVPEGVLQLLRVVCSP